jgi:3-hydroxyisobutyrate dehydrogenase-like beta-hydroxyacid dehydrogenase
VRSVYLDESTGVIAATNKGNGDKLFFEMSTIEASITREVGKAVMDAGFGTYFDSPISVCRLILWRVDYRVVYQVPKTQRYHL